MNTRSEEQTLLAFNEIRSLAIETDLGVSCWLVGSESYGTWVEHVEVFCQEEGQVTIWYRDGDFTDSFKTDTTASIIQAFEHIYLNNVEALTEALKRIS